MIAKTEPNLKHLIEVISEKYPAKRARAVVALAVSIDIQACLSVSATNLTVEIWSLSPL